MRLDCLHVGSASEYANTMAGSKHSAFHKVAIGRQLKRAPISDGSPIPESAILKNV